MAETLNPTVEELADYHSVTNGNISRAQDEIVRRLKLILPVEIPRRNAAEGWAGPDAIRMPKDIQIAPAVLTDKFLNMLLVGVSVNTTPQGIGGSFRNTAQVVVYSVDERIEVEQQTRISWARAEAIRTCLAPFLSGCRNAQDQPCWRMLEPTGYSMLPPSWNDYSGTSTLFTLVQNPGT